MQKLPKKPEHEVPLLSAVSASSTFHAQTPRLSSTYYLHTRGQKVTVHAEPNETNHNS